MANEAQNRRAVVVDDDADIRLLLSQTLGMQGFDVVQAATGAEGLDRIREHRPDLVTLDLNLPDLDGTEVCRRLREFSDAYVIMVTARSEEIDELMGLQIGADDYVSKPFSPRAIQARITAMFRRPRSGAPAGTGAGPGTPAGAGVDPSAGGHPGNTHANADASATGGPDVLTHGRLRVDVESRLASLDGRELSLTRTEFDLLALMAGSPRRIWSREVLLRSVWGHEWAANEHLVEVHVGNLRRKL
ncbi:MAG TPA: response regulator transcription factor, partial [Micrococcaceae bacterium]